MLAGPRLYVGSCHTASYPLEPFGRRSCLSSRIDPRAGCLPSFPLGRHSIGRKASAFSLQPPTSSMPQLPWTLAQGAHPRCPHRQILVEHDILWLVAVVNAPVLGLVHGLVLAVDLLIPGVRGTTAAVQIYSYTYVKNEKHSISQISYGETLKYTSQIT